MDRALPEYNRQCVEREMKVNRLGHKDRLRTVSKQIDMGEPSSLSYPPNKAKKEQMVEGK
jgi:hypothetical protein